MGGGDHGRRLPLPALRLVPADPARLDPPEARPSGPVDAADDGRRPALRDDVTSRPMDPNEPADDTRSGAAGPMLDPRLLPTWVRGHTNLAAMLVTAVMVGLALFLIAWLAPVLAPLGLGLFLAALAAPLFTWLDERGRSAALALTLTISVVIAIGGGLVLTAASASV